MLYDPTLLSCLQLLYALKKKLQATERVVQAVYIDVWPAVRLDVFADLTVVIHDSWLQPGVLQAQGDDQLPVREGAAQPSIPRRARPEEVPQRRGALHFVQAVRSHLPGPGRGNGMLRLRVFSLCGPHVFAISRGFSPQPSWWPCGCTRAVFRGSVPYKNFRISIWCPALRCNFVVSLQMPYRKHCGRFGRSRIRARSGSSQELMMHARGCGAMFATVVVLSSVLKNEHVPRLHWSPFLIFCRVCLGRC